MTAEICARSATSLVDALAEGELAPTDILAAIQERVSAVNPTVNALVTFCYDRARERMSEPEGGGVENLAPLHGLPIPIKDSYEVSGVRTTWGSLAYRHHIAKRSDYLVEAIEAAGGVVFAKSNTPEFEAGAHTFNEVFGHTLNPWNLSRSAAGSSGGAAVAVATGMAPIAQGSDFACSLRYPASFCGVVGLRPSPGLVPQGPNSLPFQSLSVIGPLARTVADCGLALDAMCRFDRRDPLSRPMGTTNFRKAAETLIMAPRVAFSEDLGIAHVDPEIRRIVAGAVDKLTAAGLTVEEAHPDPSNVHAAFRPLRAFQFAALYGGVLEGMRDQLKPDVIWNIEEGRKMTSRELVRAESARARQRRATLDFLEDHRFLITPTAPVEPFPVGERYVTKIDGHDMLTYLDWLTLGFAITVAGCPAISIPCGSTRSGLPVGMQIVGRPYADASLLAFAAWCEDVLGVKLEKPIDPPSGEDL